MEGLQNKLAEADTVIKECASLRSLQIAYYGTANSDVVKKRNILSKAMMQASKVDVMIKEYYGKNTKI